MNSADRPSVASGFPAVAPFTEWMGVVELSTENGEVLSQLTQRQELNNRRYVVHGGVLATMLDSAMARAARTLDGGLELGGTVDLHVQFMRPAEGTLVALGRVESSTRSTAFCRGELRNQTGELIACAMATMRLLRNN